MKTLDTTFMVGTPVSHQAVKRAVGVACRGCLRLSDSSHSGHFAVTSGKDA